MTNTFSSTAAFIWAVADLLRGDFKQSQYGRIILPFTLLRRLECVLEPSKANVLAAKTANAEMPEAAADALLKAAAQQPFYNASQLDLSKLGQNQILKNLESYIQGFSADAREIFEYFDFSDWLSKLEDANLLFKVSQKFANIDLSPQALSNHDMGLVFEELIRRFAESSNETAGEHFTPRDIVELATSLVFTNDDAALSGKGVIKSIYDPTAGTGGFLTAGKEYLIGHNPDARLRSFGQELNKESYAICKADMLIKGEDVSNIKCGNTLNNDQLASEQFDYMLSNPPFGVEWKKVQKDVVDEHKVKGHGGRFGPGLPRVSDGSLLFLMHLISKMKAPDTAQQSGSRIGIILNGSPLFTGGAGSGESEIRRHVLENDLLEAIIALPTDMFYNTGIATYIWIINNHKSKNRQGKVQLINATALHSSMRKSLGSKRKYLKPEQVAAIVRQYGVFDSAEGNAEQNQPACKIFNSTDFGYRRITVERPLQLRFDFTADNAALVYAAELKKLEVRFAKAKKAGLNTIDEVLSPICSLDEVCDGKSYLNREDFFAAIESKLSCKLTAADKKTLQSHFGQHDENADIIADAKGKPLANPELRDYENIPLSEDIQSYFQREVLPHVPQAWIDHGKTDAQDGKTGIVGYEIPFNRHFYQYTPPRSLEEIDADLDKVSGEIMALLQEVHS